MYRKYKEKCKSCHPPGKLKAFTESGRSSSYCYRHNNPITWIDPDGMDPKVDPKHTGDQNKNAPKNEGEKPKAPVEENYHPIGYKDEMIPKGSFPYRWGGDVTEYFDKPTGREYSVLENKGKMFSWVGYATGKAERFNGENKDAKGNWTGYWQEYLPSETVRSQSGIAAADAIGKTFVSSLLERLFLFGSSDV